MKLRFFDFEVYPNWWCCVCGDMPDDMNELSESIKNNFVVIRSDRGNPRDELMSSMREQGYCLFGYNIKHYDLAIANGVYQGFNPQQLRILNDCIIRPDCKWSTKEHIRIAPFAHKRLPGVIFEDLLDDSTGSLKEKETSLGLDIRETEVPFDKEDLTDKDIDDIIYYCKHDVYSSMVFYKDIVHPYSQTKLLVGKTFNIPEATCYKSTNAQMVGLALGAKRISLPDFEKDEITLPSKIADYCRANLPSKILEHLLTKKSQLSVRLFDNDVVFGNGGIHSVYREELYVESDDEWALFNVDAASFYPSLMIQYKLLSRAVRNPQIFTDIFEERIAIKHKANPTKDDYDRQMADKLILNTAFGASGNKYLDLYDPYMCTSVCRVGQILLAALACKLHREVPTLKVIQTNTDGILVYCNRKFFDKVLELEKECSEISGIMFDNDEVLKIWQKNVNNYLMTEREKGKEVVKCRGSWLTDYVHRSGGVTMKPLSAFIAAKAAKEWLLNKTDVIKTIITSTDVRDFAISCTKGPSYRGVIQRMSDGSEIELQKCNRVIASTDASAGKIYKYKVYKGEVRYAQIPLIPENCMLVNKDLKSYDFKKLKAKIDYMYYINKAVDLLDVNWYQLKGSSLAPTNQFVYDFNI